MVSESMLEVRQTSREGEQQRPKPNRNTTATLSWLSRIFTCTHTNLAVVKRVPAQVPRLIGRVGLVQGSQLNRANKKEDLNLAQEGHAGQGLKGVVLRVDLPGQVDILLDDPSKEPEHGHSAVLELGGADVLEVSDLGGREDGGGMVMVRQ